MYLRIVLHIMLYSTRNIFRTFTFAHSEICACPIWLFLQFLDFMHCRYIAQVLFE